MISTYRFVRGKVGRLPAVSSISALAILLLPLLHNSVAAQPAPLTVPIFDPDKEEILGVTPLIGYRPVPATVLADLEPRREQAGIPISLFTASAKSVPAVVSALSLVGKQPDTASWQDWYSAVCSLPPGIIRQLRAETPQLKPLPEEASLALFPQSGADYFDVYLFSLLPTTELFNCNRATTFTVHSTSQDKQIEMLAVAPVYSNLLTSSYKHFSYSSNAGQVGSYSGFQHASSWLSSAPALASTATFTAGNVTFGKPTILNSKEAKLEIPVLLAKEFDVYAVYLAVSLRNLDLQDFESFTVGVLPQAASVALDLIPLRYDTEIANTITKGIPDVKVGIGDVSVELGSIYQQQIVFKSLKPTVTAFGLQERDFSWSLSGDALQLGSFRFVAILGVPRGSKQLPVKFYAQAKYAETWFSQGGLVSTAPLITQLKFSN